jgi:4-oxalocrotonate tautomerase
MSVVHFHVWDGVGEEKTRIVMQKITQVFVDLGISPQAVEIIVHEILKTHWRIGGQPASEKFKDIL